VEDFNIKQKESGHYVRYSGFLVSHKADISVGGIVRTATESILMDVSRSYIHVSWEWYVPCSVNLLGWKIIFKIFSPSAWLSILLSTMLGSIVVDLLERFGVKEYRFFRRAVM
jgi:hypothetical protein